MLADKEGLSELTRRITFVLMALVVYRIGAHIPVPGLDPNRLAELFSNAQQGIFGLFNLFSGGALSRLTIFALGIMPYISASIIVQLMAAVVPHLEQLKKEGENGRRKISQYTRYLTVILATVQAIAMAKYLVTAGVAYQATPAFFFTTTLSLVTGTMFLMWLGEKITERGIGNGISLIIFSSIVSGLPQAIGNTFEQVRQGLIQPIALLLLVMVLLGITAFIVYIERAQRRIPVHHAQRQVGRMGGQPQSHLPFKINMAGVIPAIFASSLLLFPATLAKMISQGSENLQWLADIGMSLAPGQPLYVGFFAVGVVFFCFVYTAMMFNPKETADNLKRSGAFIPGIRPGEQTTNYLDKVITRLTLIGSMYITGVALLPELLVLGWQVPFYFGGTSLLIVVVVVMDFIAQVQAHLISRQYDGIMKKGPSRGKGPSRIAMR